MALLTTGKTVPLLTMEQAAELLSENLVYWTKEDAAQAIKDMLAGKPLTKRGINIMGPEGIGKTTTCYKILREHTNLLRARWEAMDEDDRLHYMRHLTVDRRDIDGTMRFEKPWEVFSGWNTQAAFNRLFRKCAPEGNIAYFDDYDPLGDNNQQGRLTRLMVKSAMDSETDGLINMRNIHNIEGGDWNHHGFILITWNRQMDHVWDGQPPISSLFTKSMLDHFSHHEICFDLEQRRDFIFATAFVANKNMGLWKFLTAPDYNIYPDDYYVEELRGQRVADKDRGLGFVGSDDEACALIAEVLSEFYQVWNKLRSISYRTVKERLQERLIYPDTWKRLLLQKLRNEEVR